MHKTRYFEIKKLKKSFPPLDTYDASIHAPSVLCHLSRLLDTPLALERSVSCYKGKNA